MINLLFQNSGRTILSTSHDPWRIEQCEKIIDFFFLEFAIQLPKLLAAQYTIPVTGMVLGNCLRSNVISINAFYYSEGFGLKMVAQGTKVPFRHPFHSALLTTSVPLGKFLYE